ncbi:uncharacterized protein LOC108051849 [Drosophila rhopaloa]|uniref:Uncharacterized protein LOC108051849 n=1 Tax=Drosophila rhopaloa TaxID=1041015 RepID=A0A6P4FWL9_DRORH|nr:uncharacterized protein LOC108051849 [Drosophila rhopaloa]
MSAFGSFKKLELEHIASTRSSLSLDSQAVEQLRHQWYDYFSSLPKTPFELQLAKARADRALELVKSKQKTALEQVHSTPKSVRRPLTALHTSPRTTSRMKEVERRMQQSKFEEPRSQYNLCPKCGLVKDSIFNHRHAEERLKKLLEQHPSLVPMGLRRPRHLRLL